MGALRICAVVLCLYIANCYAAGFDCDKAKGEIEDAICEDQQLLQLDDVLDRTYKSVLAIAPEPGTQKGAQGRWLATVRNRCKNTDCLVAAYEKRINELETFWNERFNVVGIARSSANAERSDPFEGEWRSCQLWKGEEICSSHVLLQNGNRVCGDWEYWATYRTYSGQLQAITRTGNSAKLELICGTVGSNTSTECDSSAKPHSSWEKAKGGLLLCSGRLYSSDGTTPCSTSLRSVGFLYRPMAAVTRTRLFAEPWVKRCLGID
jgi:uncharacterized protein